jgi:hypothetical protein
MEANDRDASDPTSPKQSEFEKQRTWLGLHIPIVYTI